MATNETSVFARSHQDEVLAGAMLTITDHHTKDSMGGGVVEHVRVGGMRTHTIPAHDNRPQINNINMFRFRMKATGKVSLASWLEMVGLIL